MVTSTLYQYLHAGKARVEISMEAGIDMEAFGKGRLKTAFGNWLTKHKRGIPTGMPPRRKKREGRRSCVERLDDELARLAMGKTIRTTVAEMCRELKVSPSGCHSCVRRKARGPSPRDVADLRDFSLVKAVYDYRGYPEGSRTIAMMIPRLPGTVMNRKKISRLMKKFGLSCQLRRIAKAIMASSVFSDKPKRQFAVPGPGLRILADVSYVRYGRGKLCFLSAVKDASTNEIVAWELSEMAGLPSVLRTVRSLAQVEWLPSPVFLHGGQGCHYTSRPYRSALSLLGISQSMSRNGNCRDNAPMESWFGYAKDEIPLKGCDSFAEARPHGAPGGLGRGVKGKTV